MTLVRQCCSGDFRDVVGVDERFGNIAHGKDISPASNGSRKLLSLKFWLNQARPNDRPVDAGVLYDAFGAFGFLLATAGHQDQLSHPKRGRQVHERQLTVSTAPGIARSG